MLKTKIIITQNKISGIIFAIVAIKLIFVACWTPRNTRQLKNQIKHEPPMILAKLFPPANTPGKK